MIHIYDGNTGQGKTYMTGMETLRLLHRNKKWYETKKTKTPRTVATNMALSLAIQNQYKGYISFWTDMEQLVSLRQCDVIFDDMATYLDSQRWTETPLSVKRWLRLHEHYGCDIYGNAQDFLTIDPSVRRLTGRVDHVSKIIGSRRPSATKPEVKRIWGVLTVRRVKTEEMDKEKIKRTYEGLPRIEFIKRKICDVFDTAQDIQMGEYPPLQHIERGCNHCGELKIKHV